MRITEEHKTGWYWTWRTEKRVWQNKK